MLNPKISIVTVCFNAVDTINDTILSVLDQQYENIEYIIIDGGSTDGTVDVIRKYSDNISFWISEKDEGIYDAMNKGLEQVTGDYINFMNAGDKFANSEVLQKVSRYMAQSSPTVLYGRTILNQNGKILRISRPKPFFNQKTRIKSAGFCHQSTFIQSSIIKEYKFDTRYKIAADFNLLNCIYKNNGSFVEIPFDVSSYDVTGISSINHEVEVKEFAAICGVGENSIHFYNYLIINRLKRFIKKILYGNKC